MLTDGRSKDFLDAVLADPEVRFIQVFADDSWIEAYEPAVRASGKTVAFEGPGKDPFIVLAGADIDAAVAAALESGLFAGGAACMSPERYYVHDDIADAFVERLARRLEGVECRAARQSRLPNLAISTARGPSAGCVARFGCNRPRRRPPHGRRNNDGVVQQQLLRLCADAVDQGAGRLLAGNGGDLQSESSGMALRIAGGSTFARERDAVRAHGDRLRS